MDLKPAYKTKMQSSVNTALPLVLTKGNEGICAANNVEVYEGLVSFQDINDHFQIEANSDAMSESAKMQRDLTQTRIKNLINYFQTRQDTSFPSMTVFVSNLDIERTHAIGSKTIIEANLNPKSDRYVSDGQGRTGAIKQYLSMLEVANDTDEYQRIATQSMNVKFVVTGTKFIAEKSNVVRQLFSDLHGQVKTPTASLNLYFDTATHYGLLVKSILDIRLSDGSLLINRIAVNGNIKRGQLWNLAQFADFIKQLTGLSQSQINKLSEEELSLYTDLSKRFCVSLLNQFDFSPLDTDEWLMHHKHFAFTKALFAKAFGLLGNSLLESAMVNGEKVNFSCVSQLSTMFSFNTLDDRQWIKAKISIEDTNSAGQRTIKIAKGCHKGIARLFCNRLRVMPSLALV